jgi:hypothetical protein
MIKESVIKKLDKYFVSNRDYKGKPSSDKDIEETENLLQVTLDKDYVWFLRNYGTSLLDYDYPVIGHNNAAYLERCEIRKSINDCTLEFRGKNYSIVNEGYVIGSNLFFTYPIVFGHDQKIHICINDTENFKIADTFEGFLQLCLKGELSVIFDYIKQKRNQYSSFEEYKAKLVAIKNEIKKGKENDPKWVTNLRKYFSEHMDNKGKPAAEEDINMIEQELKINLSEDYKLFLTCFGSAEIDVYPIYGFHYPECMSSTDNVIEENKRLRSLTIPYSDKWLIISEDQSGNPIGIDENGYVYMHDQDFGEVVLLAKTFGKFIEKCINDTLWN